MSDSVIWRNATPSDAPLVAKVHRAAWFATYESIYPASLMVSRTEDFFHGYWVASLTDDRSRTLLATFDGEIKGLIRYAADGEVRTLYVLPEAQRRGIGETLLDEAELDMGRVGASQFRATLVDGNDSARAFFTKHGYDVTREYDEAWDAGYTAKLLEVTKPVTG